MELQIKIIGGLFILLAFLHVFFPKYFNWKQELGSLSLINRQMMYVHMFFIAFGVFLLGLICLTSSEALLGTAFGKRISLGLGIFWAARLYVQLFVYSPTLWKGWAFETMIHILFCLFWTYVSTIFLLGYLTSL
jgi:hypothetical protein